MQARQILIALAIRNKGDWSATYNDILKKAEPTEEELAKAEGVECLTLLDEDYPTVLKQSFRPPFVLFYKGNKSLLNDTKKVAVLGSRSPKERTENFTEKFINKRSETIISELNKGIDEKALKLALKNGNRVIAVMGSGIDYCYPKSLQALYTEIALNGLLISEYPFDTLPDTNSLMFRKRITASLASHICLMDSKKKSGSDVLINFALEQGKEIYVCPDMEDDEESQANELIEQGANCLTLATELE